MYVLYADIMGFKERVMRTEHSKLKKEFEKLKTALDNWFLPTQKADPFKTSFFSDSILIVDESTKEGFNRISKAAAGLMQVSLEHKFPLKGVISKGPFTYDEEKQLFFGKAIVDAYLLQEQVYYYGIVAHHSVEEDIKEYAKGFEVKDNGNMKGVNPYVLSPIPLKLGNTAHYHLAYNLISEKRETGKNVDTVHNKILSWLESISATVSGTPRIYMDKTIEVLTKDLSIFKECERKSDGKIEFPLSHKPYDIDC